MIHRKSLGGVLLCLSLMRCNAEQLPALKAHINDNRRFEVKLQIEMAISRIENGDEALGSVWKQMANRTILIGGIKYECI